ncbi:transforming growth factor beta-1-induced transcript 1 protein-like [Paramacrobiotus metropolitanus]|uniref:transforming growth factor beta-1-induced transcript 1 protein-like n=1 Tax=Paramacrobiotus metropolitanus TaxID=2943436 RepID=UPI002445CD58|nr:transforming growth factor beta-1-induced transcript 1 protein-like [Paramacrobiotus metropolitanus]XP_055332945.1 transforming growth factor beta-1-induced transcript 1 protein-like [Paramacrobiotus metropolitanus]
MASNYPCSGCSQPIFRDQEHLGIPEVNRFYHPQCLHCTGCHDRLNGPFSLWENQHPLCDRCLAERSPRCEACQYPVADVKVKTKFGYLHPDCFTCTNCKFPFVQDQERSYFTVDGRPYCHQCAIEETRRPAQGVGATETMVREG